jgi:hypothetical protein
MTAANTMTEVPPGGVNTFAATGALSSIEIASSIDRFVIISTGANGVRSYVTQFTGSGGDQMDYIFLIDSKQLEQSIADNNITAHPSITALAHTPWIEDGILYLASVGTSVTTNFIHAVPIGVDWAFASSTLQRAITPAMDTPNCVQYTGVFTARDNLIGGDFMGKRSDASRTYYRISGITDNTGSWTLLSEPPIMSGITPSSQIQLMYEFRGITDYCIPARIFVSGVIYEDLSTDSHYRFSATMSTLTGKTFAFRMTNTFGSVVPPLRIRLYDDVAGGAAVIDDNTISPSGTWEKSINDGLTWGAYNTIDKHNDTTYIRYTNTSGSLDGIKVRVILTLY